MYKIGEFSKLCQISVKTLRYYSDIGLLCPKEVDPFTGYRMYSGSQLQEAIQILALKELGFSLDEIREYKENSIVMLEHKEDEIKLQIQKLQLKLEQIEFSKHIVEREDLSMFHIHMKQVKDPDYDIPGVKNSSKLYRAMLICKSHQIKEARIYLARYLCGEGGWQDGQWQIVSNMEEKKLDDSLVEIGVLAWKLAGCSKQPQNDQMDIPFHNDEEALGRWEVVSGDCYVKSEFSPDTCSWTPEEGDIRELYFLPEGQKYWFMSWTKGYVKIRLSAPVCEGICPYEIRDIEGEKYMFLWFKSRLYFYRQGLPTLIILKKTDSAVYQKKDIRIYDRLPDGFEDDPEIHGNWQAIDFVRTPDSYNPEVYNAGFPKSLLYFKRVSVRENGKCSVQYGEEKWSVPKVSWTKDILCDRERKLAQHYIRKVINGREYLFIEFKSGDYFYNHLNPWWYVFVREV